MKTTRRPMWMRLSAVIVAISMLMCIFAGCQKKEPEKSPMEYLKAAINNTVDKANAQIEEAELKDFCGSAEIKLNLTEMEMLKEYMTGLEGMDIEAIAKLYFDTAKPATALEVAVGGSGIQVVDALLYLDQENLALDVASLFLSETYGVDLANFEKNFDSSVFGPDGAYSLGISYDEIAEMIGGALADMPTFDAELAEKSEAFLNDFSDTLIKSIEENCEVEKESGSVNLNGTDVKTENVAITLGAVDAVEVLEDMAIFLRDDENALNVIEFAYDIYAAYGLEIYFASDAEEYYDLIDEFLAEIDDLKAEIADVEGKVELTFHVNADKNELIGISVKTIDMEESADVELLWGPSVEDFKAIALVAELDGEKTEALCTIDKENTDSKYKANITLSVNTEYDEIEALVGVEWDKNSGDAAFYVEALDVELRAEANIKVDGDKITIGLGKIAVLDEEPIDLSGVYITVNSNDVMPAVPEYTDLLTMSEAEFEELIESIADLIDMFG